MDEKLREEIRRMTWILSEIYQKGKDHSTINYMEYADQIQALFTTRLKEVAEKARDEAIKSESLILKEYYEAKIKAQAKEIKRELEKIPPMDEFLYRIVITPSQWHDFWKRWLDVTD